MKRLSLILCSLFLLLGTGILLANAQRTASVSFAQCTSAFGCPNTPTPAPQPGTNPSKPGDPDGDGIPNGIDQCPNDGGPSSNSGCPIGRSFSAANPQVGLVTPDLPVLLPFLPATGNCVLATKTSEGVNIRNQPSTSSAILGTLDPKVPYLVISILHNSEGIWYRVIPGWVAQRVVRTGGDCDKLPVVEAPDASDAHTTTLSYPDGFKLTVDKGDGSGEDTAQGYCASAYGIDVATSLGVGQAIHIEFGDGSVRTCLKLDADGHGFGIVPPDPCDVTEGDKYCWNLPTHSYIGLDEAGVLTLVSFFQPSNPAGQPPPDPAKVGVMLSWGLIPPGPCKSGETCSIQAQTFFVNFVPPGPCKTGDQTCHAQGVLLSWGSIPPGPCKTSDQSCHAQGLGLDWGLGDPPDPDVTWFSDIDGAQADIPPWPGGFTINWGLGNLPEPDFHGYGIDGVDGFGAEVALHFVVSLPAVQ